MLIATENVGVTLYPSASQCFGFSAIVLVSVVGMASTLAMDMAFAIGVAYAMSNIGYCCRCCHCHPTLPLNLLMQ